MKKKKNEDRFPFPRDFRKAGQITFEGKAVQLWISRKTGELGFSAGGKAIADPDRYEMILAYLKKANAE